MIHISDLAEILIMLIYLPAVSAFGLILALLWCTKILLLMRRMFRMLSFI